MTAPLPRTPWTDDDRRLLDYLAHCRFTPGSWDKRFVRDLRAEIAAEPDRGLTARQRESLQLVAYRYRRQWLGVPARRLDSEARRLVYGTGQPTDRHEQMGLWR